MKKNLPFLLIFLLTTVYGFSQTATNKLDSTGNVGVGTTTPPGLLSLAGNRNASSWTTNGVNFQTAAATYTNSSSTAGSTVSAQVANSLGVPTFSSNNAITVTNATNLYLAGAPIAGTNTSISNAYALYVNSGNSYFGGRLGIGSMGNGYPTEKLNVGGNIGVMGGNAVRLYDQFNSNFGEILFDESSNYVMRSQYYNVEAQAANNINLKTYNYGASFYSTKLTVLNGGNVGVGTTAPGAKFESLSTGEQMRLSYSTGNYTSFTVAPSGALTVSSPNVQPVTFNNGIALGNTAANLYVPDYAGGSYATNTAYSLGGASNTGFRIALRGTGANTLGTNYSGANFLIGGQSITTASSGTHSIVAQQAIKPLTITNTGTASITNSATLYLENAATGAQNNYSLWVDDGVTRFDGSVGIGTNDPGTYQLAVKNTIGAGKVKVLNTTTWPDYVFAPSYKLLTLKEVEAFIQTHKHLPDVPSADEVKKDGLDVGDNQATLLKKIEELTLYVIEMKKEIDRQKREIAELKIKAESN